MTDKTQDGGVGVPEPKQKSLKGYEIPVPKRRDLMGAFRKIVQPIKKP